VMLEKVRGHDGYSATMFEMLCVNMDVGDYSRRRPSVGHGSFVTEK